MAYFNPYIDKTGLHTPTYEDIRDELISEMKQIFGTDIYIDSDSQDYQQVSIFAKKIYDTNALAVLIYNNRTANTAIGVGLDNLCALVGIYRQPATNSAVQVTVTGIPSTVITNGKVSDGETNWLLPESVTIPDSGQITVECNSEEKGYHLALPNTVTKIVTPVYGWLSVTNTYQSTPGVDEETDSHLRGRYSRSTQIPALCVFDGITASLQSLEGVSRVKGYENDTGTPDELGLPAHSITFVVEGGDEEAIATQIYDKKTPGCYTNGTTEVEVSSVSGNVTVIRFYRPTYKPVYVKVSLKKLAGYNDIYEENIKNALVEYINNLEIAETVYRSVLWSVATSQMGSILSPQFAITDIQLSVDGINYTQADIELNFYNASIAESDNIIVEVS